jgi:hypothetical protein
MKEISCFFTYFLLLWLLLWSAAVCSQSHMKPINKEHHFGNKNPAIEIVVSFTSIETPELDHSDPSTEIHITYWVNHKWAFGAGYTFIFENEGRIAHEVAALVSHKPWPILTINTGPSFSLPNSEQDVNVSAYLEGELNITFNDNGFHFGPVLGTLLGENFRYFWGIHLGYEF